MFDHFSWIPTELQALADEGLLRQRRELRPLANGRCVVDGHEVWDFASNDYLCLANDERVSGAAAEAVRTHGVGAKASPLVSGRTDIHAKLERALAEFEGTSAAILFPTGMAANVGTVAALTGAGDAVFSDRLNHASLVDGCRLSKADLRIFRHDDLTKLDHDLSRESARRKFIVTDSIFSMDGDLAPLRELCDIADRHGAAVIVDEAHGTGVFGVRGRGVAEWLGVEDRVAVRVGTLSKAVGTLGGFVTGSQPLIDFLWNKARTQIFSTGLPPAICAAAVESLKIIQAEPFRRERLMATADLFRKRLNELGVSPVAGSCGPIVPIILRQARAAVEVGEKLLQQGFLVGAIRPPSVPEGTSRLRVALHYGVPDDVVEALVKKIFDAVAGCKRD